MTPEQTALSRELVSHPRFPWREGLSLGRDGRIIATWVDEKGRREFRTREYDSLYMSDPTISLTDAATAGVLLDLVNKERGDAAMVIGMDLPGCVEVRIRASSDESWCFIDGVPWHVFRGACLGEACARALLVLWGTP